MMKPLLLPCALLLVLCSCDKEPEPQDRATLKERAEARRMAESASRRPAPSDADWAKFSSTRMRLRFAETSEESSKHFLDTARSRSEVITWEENYRKAREERPKREREVRDQAADLRSRLSPELAALFDEELAEEEKRVKGCKRWHELAVTVQSGERLARIYRQEPMVANQRNEMTQVATSVMASEQRLAEIRADISPSLSDSAESFEETQARFAKVYGDQP